MGAARLYLKQQPVRQSCLVSKLDDDQSNVRTVCALPEPFSSDVPAPTSSGNSVRVATAAVSVGAHCKVSAVQRTVATAVSGCPYRLDALAHAAELVILAAEPTVARVAWSSVCGGSGGGGGGDGSLLAQCCCRHLCLIDTLGGQ
jgi:hypothetical protein